MSEETMSNEERSAILGQVFKPTPITEKKDINTPKTSSDISEVRADLSQPTFGELLDQSLAIRESQAVEDEKEEQTKDITREQAIKISRMDLLEGWRL